MRLELLNLEIPSEILRPIIEVCNYISSVLYRIPLVYCVSDRDHVIVLC